MAFIDLCNDFHLTKHTLIKTFSGKCVGLATTMFLEVERHREIMANEHITIGSNCLLDFSVRFSKFKYTYIKQ